MRRPASRTRAALAALLVFGLTLSSAPAATAVPEEHASLRSWDLDTEAPPSFQDQQLAAGGTLGFNCVRIPALTTAKNGWVIGAWDGRPTSCADAPQPNTILFSLSKDHGKTWSEIDVLAQGITGANRQGFSDPSFVTDRETGRIFAFFVRSFDWAWPQRNNEVTNDRQVMDAVYFHSDDNGQTWSGPTLVTDALNPAPQHQIWTGRFATSGEGIQLRYGPYAGRLIQQYVVYNKQTGQTLAVSLYSDDHGATWKAGEPVGPGMDENKVVELSDGRVMMNSRKSDSSGGRYISYSSDGGHTWSPRVTEPALIDPRNNASIIRAFPNAPMGSREAKILLFSNSASASSRVNGTIRISYDDGQTWPDAKVFEPGSMSYSTMTTLADGSLGMLFEKGTGIEFAKLTWSWLDGQGVSMEALSDPLHRGTNEVEVSISRSIGGELPAGKLTVTGPPGIEEVTVDVPAIAAGIVGKVKVPVVVADTVSLQSVLLNLKYAVNGTEINGTATLPFVLREGETVVNPQLRVDLTRRSPLQELYRAGDQIQYALRVESLASGRINAVPRSGVWLNLFPTCRWNNLAAGANYTCGAASGPAASTPPIYTVTEADIQRGWIEPEMVWAVSTGNDPLALSPVQELVFKADRIQLQPVTIINKGPVAAPRRIVAGAKIEYAFEYTNGSDRAYAVVPISGSFARLHDDCHTGSLAGGATFTCTVEYTVSADDVERGSVQPSATFKIANVADAPALYERQVTAPATTIVTFSPSITVPAQATAGESAQLNLTGFIPEEKIQLSFNGDSVSEFEADANGDAGHLLAVPGNLKDGSYPVSASQGDLVASVQLVVKEAALPEVEPSVTPTPEAPVTSDQDQIVIRPAIPRPGQRFTAEIAGFQPDEEVRLEVRSDPITLGTARADGQGRVSFDVVLPSIEPGAHHIVAVGMTSGRTVSYAFSVPEVENGIKLPGTGGAGGAAVVPLLVLAIAGTAIGWAAWRRHLKA